MRRIVFLDMDGVLCTPRAAISTSGSCSRPLAAWLAPRGHAGERAISSTSRADCVTPAEIEAWTNDHGLPVLAIC
jgi:hypothetical protein